MPVYKNKKSGKWFCKFYYKDWQGNNLQKKKKAFLHNGRQKNLNENFKENQKQTVPCYLKIWFIITLRIAKTA